MDRLADRGELALMVSKPDPLAAPTGLVSLADIVASGPDDQEPAPGFPASLRGETVEVTAVLKRTAVVAPLGDRWADKQLVRLAALQVDPHAITCRPKPFVAGFRRRRDTSEQRHALRAASDRRARDDQARQAAADAVTGKTAAPQRAARTVQPRAGTTTSRPTAAAVSQRATTASAVTAPRSPAASQVEQSACDLAAELGRARHRIAELEAELERHRAMALHVVRRVEVVVGRRAA
jgi:hypothetical protein